MDGWLITLKQKLYQKLYLFVDVYTGKENILQQLGRPINESCRLPQPPFEQNCHRENFIKKKKRWQ